jgi:hypothetical protein
VRTARCRCLRVSVGLVAGADLVSDTLDASMHHLSVRPLPAAPQCVNTVSTLLMSSCRFAADGSGVVHR